MLTKPPRNEHLTVEGTVDASALRQLIECAALQALFDLAFRDDRHDIHTFYNGRRGKTFPKKYARVDYPGMSL